MLDARFGISIEPVDIDRRYRSANMTVSVGEPSLLNRGLKCHRQIMVLK